MVIKRFRVKPSLSGKYVCSLGEFAAGAVIEMTQFEANRDIAKADIANGTLIFVEEIDQSEPAWRDQYSKAYQDAMAPLGDNTSRFTNRVGKQDDSVFTESAYVDWVHTSGSDLARIYPEVDAVVESIEFTSLTKAELGTASFLVHCDVKKVDAAGTATLIAEDSLGPTRQKARNVMVGVQGGTIADETTDANNSTADDVDLGLAASGTEFLYVGYHDVFDGVAFDIGGTPQAEAATCTVEYPAVTDSGTVQWTSVVGLADTTVSSNKSLAQDGTMIWDRPKDWAPSVVASGYGQWYYVRVGSAGVALTGTAVATQLWVVSRKIRPYDNDVQIHKGEYLRIDNAATGSQYTGPIMVNVNFKRDQ